MLAQYQPLTLGGLGELLICESRTSPSRLADRLVGAGLVRRQTSAQDRRHVQLSLTAEGNKLAKQVAAVEDELEETLDDLIAGKPTKPTITLLRSLADHFPAGQALKRRRDHGQHDRR